MLNVTAYVEDELVSVNSVAFSANPRLPVLSKKELPTTDTVWVCVTLGVRDWLGEADPDKDGVPVEEGAWAAKGQRRGGGMRNIERQSGVGLIDEPEAVQAKKARAMKRQREAPRRAAEYSGDLSEAICAEQRSTQLQRGRKYGSCDREIHACRLNKFL